MERVNELISSDLQNENTILRAELSAIHERNVDLEKKYELMLDIERKHFLHLLEEHVNKNSRLEEENLLLLDQIDSHRKYAMKLSQQLLLLEKRYCDLEDKNATITKALKQSEQEICTLNQKDMEMNERFQFREREFNQYRSTIEAAIDSLGISEWGAKDKYKTALEGLIIVNT